MALLGVAACVDAAPPLGPGTVTATLHSPNGAEGAAVLQLVGEGVVSVEAVGDTEVYAVTSAYETRVVLVNQVGGTLAFQVALADLGRPPVSLVREVAGPDDELRGDLSDYRVELSP
jgi:hypothetical protein